MRGIGEPRLLVMQLPARDVRSHQEIARSIYRFHMNTHGVRTRIGYGCEGTVRRIVLPSEIEAAWGLQDDEFERLTKSKSWDPPLS